MYRKHSWHKAKSEEYQQNLLTAYEYIRTYLKTKSLDSIEDETIREIIAQYIKTHDIE